jgi:hypothetical protein
MQLQTEYNLESAIFLLFHPELVAQSGGGAGKLPLSLYETVWTSDSSMEVDGAERNQSLKFRELRYSVESGEAEMISVDFVARGGANATAVEAPKAKEEKKGKGKTKDGETNGATQPEQSYLSAEDDERMFAYSITGTLLTCYSHHFPRDQGKRNKDAAIAPQPPLHLPHLATTIVPHRCQHPSGSNKRKPQSSHPSIHIRSTRSSTPPYPARFSLLPPGDPAIQI